MEMSLSEAAKAVKRTRQCLSAAILKGRLSATKNDNGEWRIDASELVRVFPDFDTLTPKKGSALHMAAGGSAAEIELLTARLEAAEELRRVAENRAEELRRERDAWQEQAAQLLRALPGGLSHLQPQVAAQPQPAAPEPKPEPKPEPVKATPAAPERPQVAPDIDEWLEVPDEPFEKPKPEKKGFLQRWFGGVSSGK